MAEQDPIKQYYNKEMRKIDRFMLILILLHLPVAAFVIPFGFGTMRIGIAGALIAGAIALAGFFLLRGHPLRLLNGLLLMFLSYLFIACQLGRIEMHFHIFGAMAFLLMYRDWKIFPSITVFIALHHGIMNYCQSIDLSIAGIPLKVFSYGDGWDIVVLHALFVVFEASVLIYMSHQLRLTFMEQERRNQELEALRRAGNREIVEEVKNSSGVFEQSAGNLLGMADELSGQANTQASAIEEISAAMEEMAASLDSIFATTRDQADGVRTLTERMNKLDQFNESVSADVENSAQSVARTAEAARSGEESLQVLNHSISEIVSSVEKMRDIVSIINDIADKVNLLSLNASIEAARAGEAGRGFTVVAEEIAKLADQTGRSIKEISGLIETSTRQAENGMKNMEQSSSVLNRIMTDVDGINKLSGSITGSISAQQQQQRQVAEQLQGLDQSSEYIRNSTDEQKTAIRQILETLESLNNATESYASSASRLNDIARENDSATRSFAERVTTLAAS